jgi:hypothetical protein
MPLADVGRVFGMAAKRVMGSSTLQRFGMARALLPEDESIFREAAETMRVVLWQQGRIGISQGTSGGIATGLPELRPAGTGGFVTTAVAEFTADRKHSNSDRASVHQPVSKVLDATRSDDVVMIRCASSADK